MLNSENMYIRRFTDSALADSADFEHFVIFAFLGCADHLIVLVHC